MKVEINESLEQIDFVRDGKLVARWFRAKGTWDSFTKQVENTGHWGDFLVFEEDKTIPKVRYKNKKKDALDEVSENG